MNKLNTYQKIGISLVGLVLASQFLPMVFASKSDNGFDLDNEFINTIDKQALEKSYLLDQYLVTTNWLSGNWLGAIPTVYRSVPKKVSSSEAKEIVVKLTKTKKNSLLSKQKNSIAYHSLLRQPITAASTTSLNPTSNPTTAPTIAAIGPTNTPTPTPVPAKVNLVVNPSFESVVNGWADTWEKSSDAFLLDTNSQGESGTNSIHFVPNQSTADVHLFSQKFIVDSALQYEWTQYLNVADGTNLNFYIDEYDTDGNWISGQWKSNIVTAFTGIQSLSYIPTTNMVRIIRLQYFVTPGSTGEVFLDSVSFAQK